MVNCTSVYFYVPHHYAVQTLQNSVRLEKSMEIKAIFSVAATLHDSGFAGSLNIKCFCYCIAKDSIDTLSLGTNF